MFSPRIILLAGCLFAGTSVALGAFGAHALPNYLEARVKSDPQLTPEKISRKIDAFEKGVRYQMYHALAIVALGLSSFSTSASGKRIFVSFTAGMILFCGGIYGTVFSTLPFHIVVPFGGLSFLLGWCFFCTLAFRLPFRS